VSSFFLAPRALNSPWAPFGIFRWFRRRGHFMSGENSYFSRFFVKFVEVSAAGLASAICAYLLAHFGGLLPAPAPATAVQVGPVASETPESPRAQPDPPLLQRSA